MHDLTRVYCPLIPSIVDARQFVWLPRSGRRRIGNHNNRICARPEPKPRVRGSEWSKILATVPCAPHRRRIVALVRLSPHSVVIAGLLTRQSSFATALPQRDSPPVKRGGESC